jgi:hypothetical protein
MWPVRDLLPAAATPVMTRLRCGRRAVTAIILPWQADLAWAPKLCGTISGVLRLWSCSTGPPSIARDAAPAPLAAHAAIAAAPAT